MVNKVKNKTHSYLLKYIWALIKVFIFTKKEIVLIENVVKKKKVIV